MEANLTKDITNWLQRRYKPNTVRGFLNRIELFATWCENEGLDPQKTTYNDLLDYVKYCTANNNQKATVNQKTSNLRHFFNFLIETGERTDNPATELTIRNQIRKAVSNSIKYEDLEELYSNYPANGIIGKRNKSVLGLMIYQGLNTGELQALEVKDLKLQEGKIYVPAVSRSNSRILKLEAQQIVQLQNYLLQVRPVLVMMNDHTSDRLFFSAGGSARLDNSFTKMNRIINKISPVIKDFQHIRSSVIAHWFKQYNTRQVQYMAGHRYVSSTERYRTTTLESLQEQLEKIHPIQ
jgi:site-specific recombinase XerD